MILEFGARNFYSFKEGFEISLRLGASCPVNISHNRAFTNVLALKGSNASGKTNALKVPSFLQYFAKNSFELKPEEEIGFDSYFENNDPTSLYIVFLNNHIEYTYEVELTRTKIISETIYKKINKKIKIIERQENQFAVLRNGFKKFKIIKLRNNASFISTAKQYGFEEIDEIYDLFSSIIAPNVNQFGRHDKLPDYKVASKFYFENDDIFNFVQKTLKQSDTGIDHLELLDTENEETGKIEYIPIFNYKVEEEQNFLTFHDQSSGVKSLFLQLGFYKIALNEGKTLVLDEFDINLHPDLLPMLIDFFEDEIKNPKNAQLIFTTHNTEIMDHLGKYRIVLVDKKDNHSYVYRLDEIPGEILRNDRPISPIYKSGKIGGVPVIENGKIYE